MATRPYVATIDVPSMMPPPAPPQFGIPERPIAVRLAPPRDVTWDLQRIRLSLAFVVDGSPTDDKYTLYSGMRGKSLGDCSAGAFPVAGVWKNRIDRDYEVLWVGCVPPGRSEYAPQIPVTIHAEDVLICGVADCIRTGLNRGIGGTIFSVRFSFDVMETDTQL